MSDTLKQRLEREFGSCDVVAIPGLGERPLVAPSTEVVLCEALRLAQADRLRVLPIGLGTKLSWMPALDRVDFVLSTRELAGVVAYEPGDGTLTALAGTRMSELESEVATGRHLLTPQVPGATNATLGGVLASGQSGFDRAAVGPPKHHILGMRVALADGRVVTSGGRLVKNVTGFDMHRLYAGSFGSLCVVLEASLRLFPAPECSFVLERECTDLAQALELLGSISASKLAPTALALDVEGSNAPRITVLLTGRKEPAQWLLAQFKTLLPAATQLETGAAPTNLQHMREADLRGGSWAGLRVSCLPSRLASVLGVLESQLPQLEIHVRPAVAEVLVRMPSKVSAIALTSLQQDLAKIGARTQLRGTAALEPQSTTLARNPAFGLMEKLRSNLDPHATFAGQVSLLGVRGQTVESV